MRIISPQGKFDNNKDFYDYLQSWGQEPGIVYNRHREAFYRDTDKRYPKGYWGKPKYSNILRREVDPNEILADFPILILENCSCYTDDKSADIEIDIVGFCGEIHVRALIRERGKEYSEEILWDKECLDFLRKNAKKDFSILTNFFDNCNFEALQAVFTKYQIPIFVYNGNTFVSFNSSLQNLGWGDIMSSEETFQAISCFLGNLKEKMVAAPMTDNEKVVAHGFDKKTSFRS